jgi:hypothetical protein
MPAKGIAYFTCVCLLLSSCTATQPQGVTTHLEASKTEREHDETVAPAVVTDFYPSKADPQDIIYRFSSGASIDATCEPSSSCNSGVVKFQGPTQVPEGTYHLARSDDPKIGVLRDSENVKVVGFIAYNHDGTVRFFPNLTDAQAFEHQGDGARTAGKILVGALLVTAIVGVVGLMVVGAAAGAAAEERRNQVTTTCFNGYVSSTCTTRY